MVGFVNSSCALLLRFVRHEGSIKMMDKGVGAEFHARFIFSMSPAEMPFGRLLASGAGLRFSRRRSVYHAISTLFDGPLGMPRLPAAKACVRCTFCDGFMSSAQVGISGHETR
jgi:hypothetical protein